MGHGGELLSSKRYAVCRLHQMKCIARSLQFIIVLFFATVLISCNRDAMPVGVSGNPDDPRDSVTFLVMGDWGKYGQQYQRPVATQMASKAAQHHARFVITTGDNFYPSGVTGTTDAHWQNSFENVYHNNALAIPWYPVLGNHDYGSNPQAEVNYSFTSERWQMPSRYYTVRKKIDAAHAVLFTFTDTSPFVTAYYNGGMSDLRFQDTAAQLNWLRQTLSSSTDTWKVVVGHHPVFSTGPHGNTQELLERFRPVFQQTHTDIYLAGHDHSLQYIRQSNQEPHYLVSGGGSEATTVAGSANTIFAKATPGFLVITLDTAKARLYFYDYTGALVYRNEFAK
jgi:tartrate-resistant acid phosphatase type 5